MTGNQALALAVQRLDAAGIEGAARDARRLLAHALGCAPDRLSLVLADPVTPVHQAAFDALIDGRLARQPVSHLVGGRYFYDHWFAVTPDVLDPRPETEALVSLALQKPFSHVLDLGTGSGAILLSLLAARPGAMGTGTDISDKALAVAARNGAALGLAARVEWQRSDWFSDISLRADLIVSNPPYIAKSEMAGLAPELRDWEPRIALTDEADGLSAYRCIAAQVQNHMTPGGRLLVEIGPTQGAAVAEIFRQSGLVEIDIHPDLDGRDRVISARDAT